MLPAPPNPQKIRGWHPQTIDDIYMVLSDICGLLSISFQIRQDKPLVTNRKGTVKVDHLSGCPEME
jgi:hypothetical protein